MYDWAEKLCIRLISGAVNKRHHSHRHTVAVMIINIIDNIKKITADIFEKERANSLQI